MCILVFKKVWSIFNFHAYSRQLHEGICCHFGKAENCQIGHFYSICGLKHLLRMHNFTNCTFMFYLRCVFSYGSSRCLHNSMKSHIDCICFNFLQCVFSNVSSNCLSEKMHSHTGCIFFTCLHCVLSNVSSNRLPQ